MGNSIEVHNLHKSYGVVKAVNGLDFYVEQGKLFAFLGPNGAGKSTTIDMICTFLAPDSGTVTVDGLTLGKDDAEIRKIIGAVFQDGLLDEPTTGLDPQTRKAVWETITAIQKQSNMTIFLTTHYMEEAANADYVIVIDGGKISAKGTPSELKEQYSSDRLLSVTPSQLQWVRSA